MKKYQDILSCYEDLKLHRGRLFGKEGFFDYQAPSSLHSEVTCFAYGIREKKSCLSLKNSKCKSKVVLNQSDLTRRFYIKLQACLFDWQQYICGLNITVNGEPAYENDEEFLENVNLGWPTVYIPIDNHLLNAGENVLEIRQTVGETALLVSSADLLSLPEMTSGQQLTCRTSVRMGEEFALTFYVPEGEVCILTEVGVQVTKVQRSPLNPDHIVLNIKVYQEEVSLQLDIDGLSVWAVMPEVVPASEDFCMVGTDSDDHRHDDTDETDRIIEIFANTGMGNFWQARPQQFRNYYKLSDKDTWAKRVDYLKAFHTKMSLTDGENDMPYFAKLCGEHFVGKHFHEAYLYFCSALVYDEKLSRELFLDTDALKNSESFGETKRLFCMVLRKMYDSCKASEGLTSVGSPSLLTSYEASSGFERVTIEPVSNVNLLIGAVRGAAPKMWGAHVPTDWYFGEPNDEVKSRKFLLAMQLLYINGADYIYAENALFKTNAFSRLDWEDAFCTRNRAYLREFYDYTIRNPREGSLKTDLAVLYGNNEYFMWHYDDRMAELPENGDWDAKIWGKWEDNRHHKCWRAIDAWLPLADKQHSKENVLNLNLFSGTPYGSVDVLPYDKEFGKYKAIALLGWNTYEDGFAGRIYDFVKEGGTAFVSYCHFNKTDRSDLTMEYAGTEEVAQLLNISGGELTRLCGYSIISCKIENACAEVTDECGNVLVWSRKIGSGILYFGTFADYNCPESKMTVLQNIMHKIGNDIAEVICSNPNICFTERRAKDSKRRIDVLNMCSNGTTAEKYTLKCKDGREYSGEVLPCEIKTITL